MVAKKRESIQFDEANLEELRKALSQDPEKAKEVTEEVVRHSFRVPCEKTDAGSAEIGGKTYPVVNIGIRGLGIRLPDDALFPPGKKLPEIVFRFRDQRMLLQGRVVHVSLEEENVYLCGISLTELTAAQEKLMLELVQQQRLAMFGRH